MTTYEDFGSRIVTGSDTLDAAIWRQADGLPDWTYDNMVAVLDMLQSRGIDYTWRMGTNRTDLVLEDGTTIEIVPDPGHPASVGSTWRDGISHYLMTTATGEGADAHRRQAPATTSVEQTRTLVADALGLPMDTAPADVTYTNRGANRRVTLPGTNPDGSSTYIQETSSDARRRGDLITPETANARLTALAQAAEDNAVNALDPDAINAAIRGAIGLARGERTPIDHTEQAMAETIAAEVAEGENPLKAAFDAAREYVIDPAETGDPSVEELKGQVLDGMFFAIDAGTFDEDEPMASGLADADGNSQTNPDGTVRTGWDAIDGPAPSLGAMIDPARAGEGAFRPDLLAFYAPGDMLAGRQRSEMARAHEVGDLLREAGYNPTQFAFPDPRPSARTLANATVTFDEADPWVAKDDVQAANQRRVMERIRANLTYEGVTVSDLDMDARGIVRYRGTRRLEYHGQVSDEPIEGQLGQIFVPDRLGTITTAFADGNNFMLAPGSVARIVPDDGTGRDILERTRLISYSQQLDQAIDRAIHDDLHSGSGTINATGLNHVATNAKGARHGVDFLDDYVGDRAIAESILRTEAGRVHYPARLASSSGLMEAVRGQWTDLNDPTKTSRARLYDRMLTGGRNMSVIDDALPGYFDPVMTTNGDTQQGLVRYLAADATVNPDGTITPAGEGGRDRIALFYDNPSLAYSNFDTFDRTVMADMNLVHSVGLSQPVGVEQAALGGWTYDDAIVVTNRFAEANPVPRAGRRERGPMVAGDKIADHHGNKGVISKVVDVDDPDTRSKAEREGWLPLYEHVKAQADAGTDVFMAPYSAVSRFNGGSLREINDNGGKARFIISENTADHKTVTYGKDGSSSSNKVGRCASSQLGWSLQAHGCQAIIDELYGPNKGLGLARQYLQVVGMDVCEDGRLSDHLSEATLARAVDAIPGTPWDGKARPIRLPFTLETPVLDGRGEGASFATIDVLPVLGADVRDHAELVDDKRVDYAFTPNYNAIYAAAAEANSILADLAADEKLKAGDTSVGLKPLGDEERARLQANVDNARAKLEAGSLKKGQTTYYTNLIKRDEPVLKAGGRVREPLSGSAIEAMREKLDDLHNTAQNAYDDMANQVVKTKLTGKHNIFKSSLLSNEVPRSATAVWTPDPTLDLDVASMSPTLMRQLGLEDGDPFLAWRDPILTTGGVHCFTVKADPELTGFAINPVMDEYFDGDFDGDTLAVVGLSSQAARDEALDKLSLAANLTSPLKYDETSGMYDLAINTGLDMKVGNAPQHQEAGANRQEDYLRLRTRANILDVWDKALDHGLKVKDPDALRATIREQRRALVDDMSAYVKDTLDNSFGKAVTDFTSVPGHMASLAENCLMTGAKGSISKLLDYAHHADVSVDPAFAAAIKGYDPTTRLMNDATAFAAMRREAEAPGPNFVERFNAVARAAKAAPVSTPDRAAYEAARAAVTAPVKGIADTVARDAAGKAVRERDRDADMKTNYATSTKAFGTGVAGKTSQCAIVITRGTPVMADALNLSSRATQGTLQIKHDAAKADIVMNSLMTGSKLVWQGKAVALDESQGVASNWVNAKWSNTKVDRDEWVNSAIDFYTSSKGMGVHLDPEALGRMADAVSKPNRSGGRTIDPAVFSPIKNLDKTPVAPIDLLAYGPGGQTSLDTVTRLATMGADIYAGAGAAFMPDDVKAARRARTSSPTKAGPSRATGAAEKRAVGAASAAPDPWAAPTASDGPDF